MYFSLITFTEEKKKWLRANMPGGHNKLYSYNYDTVSNMWRGGCSRKWVVGVYIHCEKIQEKYKATWERKYKNRIYISKEQSKAIGITKLRQWCNKNFRYGWTFHLIKDKDDKFDGYLFTAKAPDEAMAFKLRWL